MTGAVAVTGVGVVLPDAGDAAQLRARAGKRGPRSGAVHRFSVPHTDLPPIEALVGLCPDPEPEPGTGRLPRECRLAVAAARHAGGAAGDGTVGTVWASSTAGMAEYGQVCIEAATHAPGLASPLAGPQAALNGPAAAVSIRLGLTGPQLALTGGPEAGASAFVEASRMVHEGQCGYAVAGASAAVDRWRLAGTEPGLVPAEGAACLLLTGPAPGQPTARPLRRAHLRLSDVDTFVDRCLGLLARPPVLVVLSATPDRWSRARRALGGIRCWYVEEFAGDLGAAGGLLAVVLAAAAAPGLVLVLALGPGGAVAVEVFS